MQKIKLGIIREEKIPHDKRVPFIPAQCRQIIQDFPQVEMHVQPSEWRCFSDQEYLDNGVVLKEDLCACDLLMGIKEVPPDCLISGKRYLFFSHTIKKQEHNRKLLREVLKKKITLIDYECLVDSHDNRIIGFGRFAGIVGAYNGIMAYGKRYGLFDLKSAHLCHDKKEIFQELKKINLPNIKIVVTGGGRVANGACETMGAMNLRKVTPYEFLNYTFREPVYVQIHSEDFYEAKDKSPYSSWDFHQHPESYRCTFSDANSFASVTDLLIHCTFWDPRADILFSKIRMRDPDFRISVIADVTCDLNGSIPSTTKVSTIKDKFYGYDPMDEKIVEPFKPSAITVMAIDNLPCELPRDASDGFGKHLMERVLPELLQNEQSRLIERATIASNGALLPRFEYLKEFVEGKETG